MSPAFIIFPNHSVDNFKELWLNKGTEKVHIKKERPSMLTCVKLLCAAATKSAEISRIGAQ